MRARERISVIICTWNRSGTLARTLTSLAAQAGIAPDDVEVIVIDNNSNDDTRAVVERFAAGWSQGTLRYAFEPRQGKQFALNRGLEVARHPVLAFTDDDIVFPADWLSNVQRLFANTQIELAGGKTLLMWPASGQPVWFAQDMIAILGGVDLGEVRLDPPPANYAPAGANLIARNGLFDRMGRYSEAHFRHMDFEFGMRCNSASVRVVYEPSLVVYAPVAEQCLTRRYFRRWAFKAGIARNSGTAPPNSRWPAVSRWVYRQCVEDVVFLMLLGWNLAPGPRFSRELRLWRALGTIADGWHGWLRPASHAAWVERYSQKKKDLY